MVRKYIWCYRWWYYWTYVVIKICYIKMNRCWSHYRRQWLIYIHFEYWDILTIEIEYSFILLNESLIFIIVLLSKTIWHYIIVLTYDFIYIYLYIWYNIYKDFTLKWSFVASSLHWYTMTEMRNVDIVYINKLLFYLSWRMKSKRYDI